MAEEIKIPLRVWPHPSTNANGGWTAPAATNNNHVAGGWIGRSGELVNYCFRSSAPIPTDINATPAGKLRFKWFTLSANTTDAVTFTAWISDVVKNVDTYDVGTFDQVAATVADTSNGAGIENECEIAISGPTLSSDRMLVGVIRKETSGLAADIYISEVLFVANI